MMRQCLCLVALVWQCTLFGQSYVGSGNDDGITVSSSSSYHDNSWAEPASAVNTINGKGMLHEYFQASRFLFQSSIGFEDAHVEEVLDLGYEDWIDDQFSKSPTLVLPETQSIFQYLDNLHPENLRRPGWTHFSYAWWHVNSTNEDLLRHKVACALSEILVVSRNSDLGGYGDALASYYDMLLNNAFGNYRDLLLDVALHPAMGHYLSHLSNPKSDLTTGQHPDENFAREIMQLFSIGLYELNMDGSRKQQGGHDIPTYDNEDIAEFAKVFTGLGVGDVLPQLVDPGDTATFWTGLWTANVVITMRMYETDNPNTGWRDEGQHEPGPKYLLNGVVVPGGQKGMDDIEDAIDCLFNHDNVGPFIAYRLIQRMVKSNPSPQYIQRVATAFNGNGPYGTVRGDMKSVIKAILLDEEARSEDAQQDELNSRLKEPLFRYTHFSRAVAKTNPNNFYWNVGYEFYEEAKQAILASPSVFNFYLPEDKPNGPISEAGLVAPEFKIHDSRTSVGYMNNVYRWVQSWGEIMRTWEGGLMNNTEVNWDITDLLEIARDTETYINWIDKHLLGGNMRDSTREIIRHGLDQFRPEVSWHNYQENRVRIGMYLALISPEYSIMR